MLYDTPVDHVPYEGGTPFAEHTPNGCASCGSVTGPFVAGGSHGTNSPLYLCKTCVGVAATALGWLAPNVRAELEELVENCQSTIRGLNAQIEQAKDNMVVPLAEVIDFLEERAKRRPAPEPVSA
jgi:hypothetical protein